MTDIADASEAELARALAAKRKARRAPARRARAVSPKADRGRKRDPGYLAFLRRQLCSVGWGSGFARCSGHIDAAHIRTHKPGERPTGLQRKPDDCRATSLCRRHHTEQHDSGNEMRWWACYGLDPFEVAERLFAEYEAEAGRGFARRGTGE